MDPDLTKTYPLFGGLVSSINKKLTQEKASPKIQEDFEKAKRDLAKARSDWLRDKILHHELNELLADLEVRGQENNLTSDEEKLRDVLCKSLGYAEIPNYLHFCPSATSSSTLFGLTEDDVERHNPVKIHQEDLLQVVKPKVEEKLKQKCLDLYSYFNPTDSKVSSSDSLLSAKAHSLPVLVEERKNLVEREKTHLRETRLKRDKLFWSYFHKLLECLSIIETLIRDFKCVTQAETDKISVENLTALCQATCHKVRCAQMQILCETYTAETVKALKVVSGHLDTATSQARRELSATTQSLHAFRRLGPEFTALAAEMAQLQEALTNRRWGLRQFGVSGSDDSVDVSGSGGHGDSRTGHHHNIAAAAGSSSSESLAFTSPRMDSDISPGSTAVLAATKKTQAEADLARGDFSDLVRAESPSGLAVGEEGSLASSLGDHLSDTVSAMAVSESQASRKKVTFQRHFDG